MGACPIPPPTTAAECAACSCEVPSKSPPPKEVAAASRLGLPQQQHNYVCGS